MSDARRTGIIARLLSAAGMLSLLIVPVGTTGAMQNATEWGGARPGIRQPTPAEHDRFEEITDEMCENGGGTLETEREAERIALNTYGKRHPAYAHFLFCSARRIGYTYDLRGATARLERARSLIETLPAAQRSDQDAVLTDLGQMYMLLGRNEEALATIDARRTLLPAVTSRDTAFQAGDLLSDRIDMLIVMGRLHEAETDARERLAFLTQYKRDDMDLVPAERQLAEVLGAQGRYRDGLDIAATAFNAHYNHYRRFGGPFDFEDFVESVSAVTKALRAAGRAPEAEERLKDIELMRQRHAQSGTAVVTGLEGRIAEDLFFLYLLGRRYPEALEAAKHHLSVVERESVGAERDPAIAMAHAQLGLAQCGTGDYRGARANFAFAKPFMDLLGTMLELPAAAPWWSIRAECELRAGDRTAAVAYARHAIVANRALLRGAPRDASVAIGGLYDVATPAGLTLLRAQWPGRAGPLGEEQFQAVQQIRPSPAEAAALESAAAARSRAAGHGALIEEYRSAELGLRDADRQLVAELGFVERLSAAREAERDKLTRLGPGKSLNEFTSEERRDYDQAESRLSAASAILAGARRDREQAFARFSQVSKRAGPVLSDYLAVRQSAAVPLATVTKSLLDPAEALIVLTPGMPGQRGFVMVAARGETPVWAELPLNATQLEEAIRAMRSDIASGGRTRAPDARLGPGGPEGFDRQTAQALYTALFGDPAIARVLAGRENWLIVPQGAFLSLPFAALVTAEPPGGVAGNADAEQLRRTSWLGTAKALSILPSVSALAALRETRSIARSAGPVRLFAIGEPDMQAWKQTLASNAILREVIPSSRRGQIARLGDLGVTEIDALRARFPASGGNILVGPNATEERLRGAAVQLYSADVVLFATHGLIGGDAIDAIEPALLLSPPPMMTAGISYAAAYRNDGLLTASEAAVMRLSADWVILSACDTAAGQQRGDGLSGLARAFFTAGAQSLLVAQWALPSTAAKQLSSGVIALWLDQRIGKARALRAQMRMTLDDRSQDDGGLSFAHPARWAAFEYVGA